MNERDDRGAALIIVLTSLVLIMALGAGLVLMTSTETAIAANFRNGHEAFYAADAVLERSIAELSNLADWNSVLAGTARSSFADGAPTGTRTLSDGAPLDLAVSTNQANCQRATACSTADLTARTNDRPWGANNPQWTLFAYGPLSQIAGGGSIDSPFYVLAFAGDDSAETDGDPTQDGIDTNPGRGIIRLRAEAFGPRNAHKVIEATIARIDTSTVELGRVRVLAWNEIR